MHPDRKFCGLHCGLWLAATRFPTQLHMYPRCMSRVCSRGCCLRLRLQCWRCARLRVLGPCDRPPDRLLLPPLRCAARILRDQHTVQGLPFLFFLAGGENGILNLIKSGHTRERPLQLGPSFYHKTSGPDRNLQYLACPQFHGVLVLSLRSHETRSMFPDAYRW